MGGSEDGVVMLGEEGGLGSVVGWYGIWQSRIGWIDSVQV